MFKDNEIDDSKKSIVKLPDLKIRKIKTNKSKIPLTQLMQSDIIPKHPRISLFVGASNSGKSNLLVSLLIGKHFFKGYFDGIYIFTESNDDLLETLIDKKVLTKKQIKINPKVNDLDRLVAFQENLIKKAKGDILKVPKTLVIFDDILSNRAMLKSDSFLKIMVMNRHLSFSVIISSQYLVSIPKALRLQAHHLFVFQSSKAEMEILTEHFVPPKMCNRCFNTLIDNATKKEPNDEFPFLHIHRGVAPDKRFRRNLSTILNLNCRCRS